MIQVEGELELNDASCWLAHRVTPHVPAGHRVFSLDVVRFRTHKAAGRLRVRIRPHVLSSRLSHHRNKHGEHNAGVY